MSIIVKDVTKIYGKQKALNKVTFEIKTGEIVGFIGPNGAGKSTMMKIITGFIPQTSGDVSVNGHDVVEQSMLVRKNIGYLPENNPLYLDMYVKEYLEYVAGLYNLKKVSSHIKEMLERTGLVKEQNKKIGALSKGFKQRVGLAQAMIHNPNVLILDEPTSGLDPNQIVEIRNLISEVGKEKTVMLSTHIMQEVEAICQRIIIINKGNIVANDYTQNIHTQTNINTQTIVVEFNKTVKAKQLEAIKGIVKVINIKENNWLLQSNFDDDIRANIFDFAVKNKMVVLSMQKKEKSLEDIFQELTK